MKTLVFGIKNISGKILRSLKNPRLFRYYFDSYVLSKFRRIEPDIYIVSYPKCGRTWARIMLIKYLELKDQSGRDFGRDGFLLGLPNGKTLKFDHDTADFAPAPLGIDKLCVDESKYRNKKVCFIVRDPRDVLVSSFYQAKYRDKFYSGKIADFIRNDTLGINKVAAFFNIWIKNKNIPMEFLLMTYEEMSENPTKSFTAFFNFLEIDTDPAILDAAIEEASFSKMKKMEKEGSLSEPWMRPVDEKTENSMKVRKGKVGGYRDELSIEDIEYLDKIIDSDLTPALSYGTTKR